MPLYQEIFPCSLFGYKIVRESDQKNVEEEEKPEYLFCLKVFAIIV